MKKEQLSKMLEEVNELVKDGEYRITYKTDTPTITDSKKHARAVGSVVNLYERMGDKGATNEELDRVKRYLAIVIDAVRYSLDNRQAMIDLGIKELIEKYPRKTKSIRRLLEKGYSKQKIAEELGIAESAVRHYCEKHNI